MGLIESLPGLGLVLPIAAGALAIFKWVLSRHDVQFARRKEFLIHWRHPKDLDDLSIEVLIRQLTGKYLPSTLVRRICSASNLETAQTLLRLADIWSLVDWNEETATVTWKTAAATDRRRSIWRAAVWAGYFAAFTAGAGILVVTTIEKPSASIALIAAGWGVTLLFAAAVALIRTDAWGAACKWGDVLLSNANWTGTPAHTSCTAIDECQTPANVES